MSLNVLATGIEFSPMGGSSVNLLDDYEEGTFTPSLDLASVSLSARSGNYIKIGRSASYWVNYNFAGHSSTTGLNNWTLSGLPFSSPSGDSVTPITFGIWGNNGGANLGEGRSSGSATVLVRAAITTTSNLYFGWTLKVD